MTRSTPWVVGATQLEWVAESASPLYLIMNDGELGGPVLYKEIVLGVWVDLYSTRRSCRVCGWINLHACLYKEFMSADGLSVT